MSKHQRDSDPIPNSKLLCLGEEMSIIVIHNRGYIRLRASVTHNWQLLASLAASNALGCILQSMPRFVALCDIRHV